MPLLAGKGSSYHAIFFFLGGNPTQRISTIPSGGACSLDGADSGDVIGDALLEVVDGGEGEVGSQGFDGGVGGPLGGDGYIGDTLDEGGDGVDDPAHPGLVGDGDDGFAGSGGEDGEVGAHDLLRGVGRPGPLGDGDAGLVDPVVEPHEGDPGEGAVDSAALEICIVGWQDRSIIRW